MPAVRIINQFDPSHLGSETTDEDVERYFALVHQSLAAEFGEDGYKLTIEHADGETKIYPQGGSFDEDEAIRLRAEAALEAGWIEFCRPSNNP